MPSRLYSLFVFIGAFSLIGGALFLMISTRLDQNTIEVVATTSSQTATAAQPLSVAASSSFAVTIAPTTTAPTIKKVAIAPIIKNTKRTPLPSTSLPPATTTPPTSQATRIQDPYNFPPESSDVINASARGALVNILCMPRGGGSLQPISGSGVIIDSRGIILTNAHVAQYMLLSEDPAIDLSCQIRTGNPARAQWTADVLYMPSVWVNSHVAEINASRPTGTGEHDYALLRITGSVSGAPLPTVFPSLPFDSREAIGFLGDQVLGASYPAEFIGGFAAENDLYPVTSVSPIDQLLTFGINTVDAISIGGVVEAQSGSSGGAVVNAWGRLIGIISTTSDAPTTAARDLHAITLSYISHDLLTQSGSDLPTFLAGDLAAKEADFNSNTLPGLTAQYIKALTK